MIIGLTGGIASGKTTAARFLEELGAYIINADQVSRLIMQPQKKGYREVVEEFGQKILDQKGEIDRSKLGEIIFSDPRKRKKLEEITHPLIIAEMKAKIKKLKEEGKDPIVLEIPLLFETGMEQMVDQVWVVYVDETTQLDRLQNRNDLSRPEAQKRINSQMSLEEKSKRADIVVDNNGDKQDLKNEITTLWEKHIG
ncbi:MAG: dephospho-CoA kinase [Bacillota bacterium]